jgi:hypothetical protein
VLEAQAVFALTPPCASNGRRLHPQRRSSGPTVTPKLIFCKIYIAYDLVGMPGFEPGASCSQSRRANQAAPHPVRNGSLSSLAVVPRRPTI